MSDVATMSILPTLQAAGKSTLDTVLPWLVTILGSAGGGAAIALVVFRALGRKWLDDHFARRLEALKHAQQKEVERLRFQVSALLDRSVKLNQREFEVLPTVWESLSEAQIYTRMAVTSFIQHADLTRATPDEVEETIEINQMGIHDAKRLREASDKNKVLTDFLIWKNQKRAADCTNNLRMVLRKNSIFLQKEIAERFTVLEEMLFGAIVEMSLNDGWKKETSEQRRKVLSESDKLLKELGDIIQARLWNARSLDSASLL